MVLTAALIPVTGCVVVDCYRDTAGTVVYHGLPYGPLPRTGDVVTSYLRRTSTMFAPDSIVLTRRNFPRIGRLAGCEGWVTTMVVEGRLNHTNVWTTKRASFVIVHDNVVAAVWYQT